MPTRFRLAAVLLTLFLTPIGVTSALAQPADAVWVAESDGALKVRAVDGSPLLEITELAQVRAVAVDLVAEHVWLLSEGNLYLYDFAGSRLAHVVLDTPRSADAVIVARAGSRNAWVAVGDLLWTVEAGKVVGDPVDLGAQVAAMAHDPATDALWIATAGTLERLADEAAVPEVVLTLHPRERVADMALDPLAGRVWMALPQEIRVVGVDGSELGRIPAAGVEHLAAGRGEAWAATKRNLTRYAVDGAVLASARPFAGRGTIVDVVSTWNLDAWAADANRLARVTPEGEVAQVVEFHPPSKIWQLGHGDDVFPPTVELLEPPPGLCTADPRTPITLSWADVGSGVDPDATVAEIDGASVPVTWTASADGATGVPVDALADGVHQLRVTVSDRAGNASEAAETSWTVDTVPPGFLALDPADGLVTDQPEIVVSGTVDEAAEVRLVFGASTDAVTAAGDGSFAFAPITLDDGVNVLRVEAEDCAGNVASVEMEMTFEEEDDDSIPPDPATVAPPNDETVATDIASSTAFLYSGPNPIQRGVTPGIIDPVRVAVLRGRVLDTAGDPLAGVRVSIHDRPELGWTLSREGGFYDLAVNGGGTLVLSFESEKHLPVQRRIDTPWRDFLSVDDVVMTSLDLEVTTIRAGASEAQVARGSTVEDADGSRRATMIFPAGLQAEMVLPDGSRQPLSALSVRATEYTVGPGGPAAMPGELPATSGYTYAVELSVDEAMTAGATSVEFDRPVPVYVENFLEFPVGGDVPIGWYDREKAAWIPSDDGRIVEILSIDGGWAVLDVNGDGTADTGAEMAELGIDDAERSELARLYAPGTSLWRVPIRHFTPWDCNWPFGPPEDAEPPPDVEETPPPDDDDSDEPVKDNDDPSEDSEDPDCVDGSIIECQNQLLHKRLDLPGMPFDLHYNSGRVPGRSLRRQMRVQVTGNRIPDSLKRVDLFVEVAGQTHRKSFSPSPSQIYNFAWDGLDRYGRPVLGNVDAKIRLEYVYPAIYYEPGEWEESFSQFGSAPISASETRGEITLVSRGSRSVAAGYPEGVSLGGWQISPVHIFDTTGRRALLGDGSVLESYSVGQEIKTFAGRRTQSGNLGDGLPATEANLDEPHGIFAAADGSLYIADGRSTRIRRVGTDSIIETVAGGGESTQDGIPATEADIRFPRDLVVAEDGTLYFTTYWPSLEGCVYRVDPGGLIYRVVCGHPFWGIDLDADGNLVVSASTTVRKIDRQGRMTTIAGTGSYGYSGDGGPATAASFRTIYDVSVGPDGSIYVADTGNQRIRKVTPDGIVETVAGRHGRFQGPDGIPGTSTWLVDPVGVHAGPDGSVYIAQEGRIRWLRSDGIIETFAGQRSSLGNGGDGGPALAATMSYPTGITLSPTGDFFVSDSRYDTVRVVKSGSLPGFSAASFLVPSRDGSRIHAFDLLGRHLETRHGLTGSVLWTPEYDAEGRLVSVEDGDGNTTRILRSAEGIAESIEGPFGTRIQLATNPDGFLTSVTLPDGSAYRFEYGEGGLLTASIDPRGHRTEYAYSAGGRLISTTDATGAERTFDRYRDGDEFFVAMTRPSGAKTEYRVGSLDAGGEWRATTRANGTTVETTRRLDGTKSVVRPDGSISTTKTTGDPRFGLAVPTLEEASVRTPTGRTLSLRQTREVVTGDPESGLQSQVNRLEINGRVFTTRFDAASRTFESVSAEGRQARVLVDDLGRATRVESPQTEPLAIAYRTAGTVESMTTGEGTATRTTTFSYDDRKRLATVTDPLSRTISFTYDAADRITETTLADGESVGFGYL